MIPLAGTVAQAVLGGITVLTGLNPVTVALHFLLSAAIVAARWCWCGDHGSRATSRWCASPPAVRVLAGVLVGLASRCSCWGRS